MGESGCVCVWLREREKGKTMILLEMTKLIIKMSPFEARIL